GKSPCIEGPYCVVSSISRAVFASRKVQNVHVPNDAGLGHIVEFGGGPGAVLGPQAGELNPYTKRFFAWYSIEPPGPIGPIGNVSRPRCTVTFAGMVVTCE
ncbi:MAG TPA: hypothetical protein VID47_02045, partial [Actinomycetota bacterium]